MQKLMRSTLVAVSTLSFAFSTNISANSSAPLVYVNKNIGFNVEGFKYQQPAYPCDLDNKLVDLLVQSSIRAGLNMEVVETKEKINNGKVPVLLIDIEQLTLREDINYGKSKNFSLPKIQITAAVLQGTDLQTAKHTCVSATSDKLTMPTDQVVLNDAGTLVCSEARRCLEDLSKDVVSWIKPQIK